MKWYAASIIMVYRLRDEFQTNYPLFENVVLMIAGTADEAWERAEALGRSDEGDDGGSLTYGGKPASLQFAGVRKVIECMAPSGRNYPIDGTEVSYSEMVVKSQDDLRKLVAGEDVELIYSGERRPSAPGESHELVAESDNSSNR